jgi:hypothetical protein
MSRAAYPCVLAALLACNLALGAERKPAMNEVQPAALDYTLEFAVNGGDELAPGVHQYVTHLKIDGASRRAAMVLNRNNGDLIGRPIGLFTQTLAPEVANDLAAAVESLRWADLPQPTKGDITAPQLSLRYQHGSLLIQRGFNARNLEFLRAIEPLMDRLRACTAGLLQHPDRVLEIEVSAKSDHGVLQPGLVLRNKGHGPLMLADPREVGAGGTLTRAYLRVAEDPVAVPGQMEIPPIWTSLPLAPLSGTAAPILLAAGASRSFDGLPWKPADGSGGRFLVQAIFEDYQGPRVDTAAILPFAPTPGQIDSRPYLLRGAAFSGYGRFELPIDSRVRDQ